VCYLKKLFADETLYQITHVSIKTKKWQEREKTQPIQGKNNITNIDRGKELCKNK